MSSAATKPFPIDLNAFVPMELDPGQPRLTAEQKTQLENNIALCRDAIIFFTATGAAKGLGGHTGGPYDIVPEVLIADGFMRGTNRVVDKYFDEAGHRVAIQYLMSVLNGFMPAEKLAEYREANSHLPGHPELGYTPGVGFSSGRLGHMWPYVNGVAMANPEKAVFCFGSDGSQQEGNDAEAARFAVAKGLNVKVIVDDNDVTIAGHPSKYLPGYCVKKTLEGHGVKVLEGHGEDLDDLYGRMCDAVNTPGPVALINKRPMAPKIKGLENSPHGHDVIKVDLAIAYLEERGHGEAAEYLKGIDKLKDGTTYRGSNGDSKGSNRNVFGKVVSDILDKMTREDRVAKVRCIDSDLEGSCGLNHIRERHPEVFEASGIMERGNYSACAGFGMEEGKQGIFGTFSAFLEMVISEITMARLNKSNVLAHFSHAGVDDMADNTCHFGINNMFAANGLEEGDNTRLYFPADQHQMRSLLETVFDDAGLRFVFSTRSACPDILTEDGKDYFAPENGYKFQPGKDEVIREGTAGYIVSFGETLYRALDAVEQLKAEGIDVGLINKPTLNVVDDEMLEKIGKSGFVLVAESFNKDTGLGSKMGSWLLERGLTPKYAHLGSTKEGCGGLWEQMQHQGLCPEGIKASVKKLLG
ncbi:Transketolase 2 [Poriferisphaera corsica]|uniref:Transketolase 2 n=1 Tax=Poriferisphaera corsica TaxID=2528020 RepID=A0A517YZ20_9BACT|nr:transketolase C-terminal domain-containing protein [Poriferisphaera corsica]QDU35466.1 Transketolase 2 [Poriferisphaera corsica]